MSRKLTDLTVKVVGYEHHPVDPKITRIVPVEVGDILAVTTKAGETVEGALADYTKVEITLDVSAKYSSQKVVFSFDDVDKVVLKGAIKDADY